MRTALLFAVVALVVAACASPPRSQSAGAAPAPESSSGSSTVSALSTGRVAGYTRVVKDGAVLYCRDDVRTGSRIIVQTTCLTEQEFRTLTDDTRRDVERIRGTMSGQH